MIDLLRKFITNIAISRKKSMIFKSYFVIKITNIFSAYLVKIDIFGDFSSFLENKATSVHMPATELID